MNGKRAQERERERERERGRERDRERGSERERETETERGCIQGLIYASRGKMRSSLGTTANEETRGSLVRMTRDVVYYSWAGINTSILRYLNRYELNFSFFGKDYSGAKFLHTAESLYP